MSYINHTDIPFENSSVNVFADLGLEDANGLFVRAQIGFYVFKILEVSKLKQLEMADLLGIEQSDVSHLMNGHFSRFSTNKLLDFLKRLDQKVTIQIGPHNQANLTRVSPSRNQQSVFR